MSLRYRNRIKSIAVSDERPRINIACWASLYEEVNVEKGWGCNMGDRPSSRCESVEQMHWCTEGVARRWASGARPRKRSSGMKEVLLPAASSKKEKKKAPCTLGRLG